MAGSQSGTLGPGDYLRYEGLRPNAYTCGSPGGSRLRKRGDSGPLPRTRTACERVLLDGHSTLGRERMMVANKPASERAERKPGPAGIVHMQVAEPGLHTREAERYKPASEGDRTERRLVCLIRY